MVTVLMTDMTQMVMVISTYISNTEIVSTFGVTQMVTALKNVKTADYLETSQESKYIKIKK
jgi:hypothetical protein